MYIAKGFKVLLLMSLLALVGCASAPTAVSINAGGSKVFTFQNVDGDGNKISAGSILSTIAPAISSASAYRARYEEASANIHFNKVRGTQLAQIANGFKLSYLNGEHSISTGLVDLTISNAVFTYSVEERADAIIVTVSAPKQIETTVGRNPLFIPYDQFATDTELTADLKLILDNLTPLYGINKSVNGEIDAAYRVDAITANFNRKSRCSPADGKLGCLVEGVLVKVEIVPFKEGAKAIYHFSVSYSLNGHSESTYPAAAELAKKVVASLEKIVKE